MKNKEVLLPSTIKNKEKRSEVHAKLKHQKKLEPAITRAINALVIAGLPSTIASFCVLAIALGGRTSTPGVFAVGFGSVLAPLFMPYVNLYISRREHSGPGPNPVTLLHAVMTSIGILVGGLLPPLIFFCSFRRSDDQRSKLIVVATFCTVSILLQSIARATVQGRPRPYLRTVGIYMACGLLLPPFAFGVSRYMLEAQQQ